MAEPLVLRWGNAPHWLELSETPDGIDAVLHVRKPNGEQDLEAHFPPEVTLAMVQEAWAAQDNAWHEVFEMKGQPYLAVRMIWLPNGCVIWNVFHHNDVPSDSFGYSAMTRDQFAASVAAIREREAAKQQ